MTRLTFRKHLNSLVPDERDPAAVEWLKSIKHGDFVGISQPKRPRNIRHHRKFFALLHLVFDNQERYENFDDFRDDFTIALGHCRRRERQDGSVVYVPKSISFASMDQVEFNLLYDKAIALVVDRFLPGVEDADLRREVEELVG